MLVSQGRLKEILAIEDLTGFTFPLKGDYRRYVVGLTNNYVWSIEILIGQIEFFNQMYDQINIGGRTDNDWNVMIDVSTSFDSLVLARHVWQLYKQNAVYDTYEWEDVNL